MILGTRGSGLALAQASLVADKIQQMNPEVQVEIQTIHTQGDRLLDHPISKLGDKGLFVKELESALTSRQIDLAVHSAKDLPGLLPEDLELKAFPPREDPRDALVTKKPIPLDALPPNTVLGTSALRRQSQLLFHRPDLAITMIRGNVDTRLRKLDEGQYTGIVVAAAGLNRLKIKRGKRIPCRILLPAPGQGALAVEIRKEDDRVGKIVEKLDDLKTRLCVTAERSLLASMGGGCEIPLGGLAWLEKNQLYLEGFLGTPDGKTAYREKVQGDPAKALELGRTLAKRLLEKGDWIIQSLKASAGKA